MKELTNKNFQDLTNDEAIQIDGGFTWHRPPINIPPVNLPPIHIPPVHFPPRPGVCNCGRGCGC